MIDFTSYLSGITTNAIVMIGYAIGNAAGPQYWKQEYQPRYIPFHIALLCHLL